MNFPHFDYGDIDSLTDFIENWEVSTVKKMVGKKIKLNNIRVYGFPSTKAYQIRKRPKTISGEFTIVGVELEYGETVGYPEAVEVAGHIESCGVMVVDDDDFEYVVAFTDLLKDGVFGSSSLSELDVLIDKYFEVLEEYNDEAGYEEDEDL